MHSERSALWWPSIYFISLTTRCRVPANGLALPAAFILKFVFFVFFTICDRKCFIIPNPHSSFTNRSNGKETEANWAWEKAKLQKLYQQSRSDFWRAYFSWSAFAAIARVVRLGLVPANMKEEILSRYFQGYEVFLLYANLLDPLLKELGDLELFHWRISDSNSSYRC